MIFLGPTPISSMFFLPKSDSLLALFPQLAPGAGVRGPDPASSSGTAGNGSGHGPQSGHTLEPSGLLTAGVDARPSAEVVMVQVWDWSQESGLQ